MSFLSGVRQPILQHDVHIWHRRLPTSRTWANMLVHFREAQNDLRALPTVGEVYPQQPPHQANAVDTMAALVAQRLLESIPIPDEPIVEEAQANALQTRESELQARESAMHSQMQEMMAQPQNGHSHITCKIVRRRLHRNIYKTRCPNH
jgi:serine phosphatase RsbU (regulator of sigma subunit)